MIAQEVAIEAQRIRSFGAGNMLDGLLTASGSTLLTASTYPFESLDSAKRTIDVIVAAVAAAVVVMVVVAVAAVIAAAAAAVVVVMSATLERQLENQEAQEAKIPCS